MYVALKLGLTTLTCVYNVQLEKKHKETLQCMNPPKK